MCPRECILGIASVRCDHLVESSDAVALAELGRRRAGAHGLDVACYVVTLVALPTKGFGHAPVLRIHPGGHDADQHLSLRRRRDGAVDDADLEVWRAVHGDRVSADLGPMFRRRAWCTDLC